MYFDRRGEVNELKALLRASQAERDAEKAKETLKRVISYMSLGIDLSRLFPDVLMLCHTGDIVLKKLIYHYLTAHAEQNAEMAILLVNALQKDTRDIDPAVRTLALRSLANLRLSNVLEYLEPAISEALRDSHAIVRRAAVVAVAKLPRRRGREFVAKLENLLASDADGEVLSSVLHVLEHLKALHVEEALLVRLIRLVPVLSDWSVLTVLRVLFSNFHAIQTNEELFYEVMNVLDFTLTHTNNAAVMITVCDMFLALTAGAAAEAASQLHEEVLLRLRQPLVNLSAAAADPEVAAILYQYILGLARIYPELFASHFAEFTCKFSEPVFVKTLKLELLHCLASRNAQLLEPALAELKNALYDWHCDVQVAAVKHLVALAIATRVCVLDSLVLLVSSSSATDASSSRRPDAVLAEALAALRDLVHAGTLSLADLSDALLFTGVLRALSGPQAAALSSRGLCSLLWLAGEFPEAFADPLAPVIQTGCVWETSDAETKLAALRTSARLLLWDARSALGVFKDVFRRCMHPGEDPDVARQAKRLALALALAPTAPATGAPLGADADADAVAQTLRGCW